jgi:tetratricopeptide (TPR) repeat protein
MALSQAFYALERYDDAVDALDEVGRASEHHPSQLLQRVWMPTLFTRQASAILAKPGLNRRDGDLEWAIELTRRVCSSDPLPTAHLLEPRILLAQALSEKGDRSAAVSALREALYVAERFRGLDEGKLIPRLHWRLSELIRETGADASILHRLRARGWSLYHQLAARLEHRRLVREREATYEDQR